MSKVCAQCKHFIGGGDFGNSCSEMYGITTEASNADDCEDFEQQTVCKNASRAVGGFRCSICGGYKNFVEVEGEVVIEEYVKLSKEANQKIRHMTECPCCGRRIHER